jgi:hypothetical protein
MANLNKKSRTVKINYSNYTINIDKFKMLLNKLKRIWRLKYKRKTNWPKRKRFF